MIAKKFRFHGHGALNFVLMHGKQKRGKVFSIKFIKNPRRKTSRISVIISKKVFKHAVDRNRARRRVYEIVRRSLKTFPQNNESFDIAIMIYSREINTMTGAELIQQLAADLREIIYKTNPTA